MKTTNFPNGIKAPLVGTDGNAIGKLTDDSGGAASDTLAAITAGASYDQADMTAIKDAIASLAAKVNALTGQ